MRQVHCLHCIACTALHCLHCTALPALRCIVCTALHCTAPWHRTVVQGRPYTLHRRPLKLQPGANRPGRSADGGLPSYSELTPACVCGGDGAGEDGEQAEELMAAGHVALGQLNMASVR
jgi:hypothetical protein